MAAGAIALALISLALVGLAWIGLAWIRLAAFWAAPGVFSLDGFIYWAMIDAVARDGSLVVENGMNEPVTSVPVRVNPATRESRLIRSVTGYVLRSTITIVRIFVL